MVDHIGQDSDENRLEAYKFVLFIDRRARRSSGSIRARDEAFRRNQRLALAQKYYLIKTYVRKTLGLIQHDNLRGWCPRTGYRANDAETKFSAFLLQIQRRSHIRYDLERDPAEFNRELVKIIRSGRNIGLQGGAHARDEIYFERIVD